MRKGGERTAVLNTILLSNRERVSCMDDTM